MINNRFTWLGLFALCATAFSQPNCVDNQECLIDVPGSQCADGTQSYVTLTKRPGAKNTLIYLDGGGACWDKASCEGGYVQSFTRDPQPQDFNGGSGLRDASDPTNPFAKNYNVVYVPYCTADAFTGSRVADYGTPGKPYVINHHGYANVVKAIETVKQLYPNPEKMVMLGCSAGGIGAYFHMRDLAAAFPNSRKYVISDAGTPFAPPFVDGTRYQQIMKSWGADMEMAINPATGKKIANFTELMQYSTQKFKDIRFGFIDSYHDQVMTFFGWALGAPLPLQVVRDVLISAADNAIGRNSPNAKVFFTEGQLHCHTVQAFNTVKSGNNTLGPWLSALVNDGADWNNERPDLDHAITPGKDDGGTFPGVPVWE